MQGGFERRLCRRNLWGEVRKGAVEAPSEESLRRRWAFFISLLEAPAEGLCQDGQF